MRKVIAAINMTVDGYCDHTAIVPDDQLHHHYADLLSNAGTILYGRITYQLMEYWKEVVENPTGNKATDEFAVIMDRVPKIVFSRTLDNDLVTAGWESARLASGDLEKEIAALKQEPGKDIYAGSRSLIIQLMQLELLDELQLCIHPVVAGTGLPLFANNKDRFTLNLIKTKTFNSGAVVLYFAILPSLTPS